MNKELFLERDTPGGWSNYEHFVIRELDRIAVNQEKLSDNLTKHFETFTEKISETRADVEKIKTEVHLRSGFWGATSGLVVLFFTMLAKRLFLKE